MHNEGYIKFELKWQKKSFDFPQNMFSELNYWRIKLYDLGLIGMYSDGIGFGNISTRLQNTNQFIISGSATGSKRELSGLNYSLVNNYDIEKNTVYCIGQTEASSESMSHAILYNNNKEINAVVHIHHKKLWDKYLNILPTTDQQAEYGTPEIAIEIGEKAHEKDGIIIMGGHEEGIVAFGSDLKEASEKIINLYKTLKND